MHQQHPPRSNYGAANEDVMAAIAAAMATAEQTAATEAIQQRQQPAPQSSTIPQPFPVQPQTGQVEVQVPTPAPPTAFPQPPAMTRPQIPPQPVAAPQLATPAHSIATPSQFPENLVLRNQPDLAPQPEQQVSSPRKRGKNGLAISLALVATMCLAVGGAYIWHTAANSPATVENPPAQPVPNQNSTAQEPLDTGDNAIVIPVNTIPGR